MDFAKGRVYLPQDDMRRFGVSDETIAQGVATPEFRALLRHEVDYARSLFEQGLPLIGRVNRDLALDLDLFSRGGLEILRAIERCDYDVLSARPAISKTHQAGAGAARAGRQGAAVSAPPIHNPQERPLDADGSICRISTLDHAYEVCRAIAKREAKNSITPSSRFPANAATQSAPSMPSCARPTIWPTMRAAARRAPAAN